MKNRKTLINKTIGDALLGIALIVMTPMTADESDGNLSVVDDDDDDNDGRKHNVPSRSR